MTKNLGRDFTYGHETRKPDASGGGRTLFGVSLGALVPLVTMVAALLIGRYFFG